MRAAALDAFTLDRGDAAILAHPELEPDIGLRPAAMGDECLLAVDDHTNTAARLAGEQRRYQLNVQRFGATAEPAADIRLHHADPRHVHAEDLREHKMHVVRH